MGRSTPNRGCHLAHRPRPDPELTGHAGSKLSPPDEIFRLAHYPDTLPRRLAELTRSGPSWGPRDLAPSLELAVA